MIILKSYILHTSIVIAIVISFIAFQSLRNTSTLNISETLSTQDRAIQPLTLSPSEKQAVFKHQSKNSTDEISIILVDMHSKTKKEIFHTTFASWDVTSDIHWLGEEHLVFLRHCGTSCQGVTLLDLQSGQTTNAVLSYPSFSSSPNKTYFKDWFGVEYTFDGLVYDINTKTDDHDNYIIFALQDNEGKHIGTDYLLFTGSAFQEKI